MLSIRSHVATKYRDLQFNENGGEWDYWNRHQGFVCCLGWHDRLCPMDKMIRPGKMRCMYCWRQLRNTKKARRAAKKAVADVWNKFETPTMHDQPQIVPRTSEDEDDAGWEVALPDDEPKAEASDPFFASKLANILGARGECGFESLAPDQEQRLEKSNEKSIIYETVSRLAYIADRNVITQHDVKAASRCGGLPVRPPYLLPRSGMPNVADTEDDVYVTFLQKLQSMTSPDVWSTEQATLRAKTFFDASNMEKVRCCKAALAAACVAHNKAQGIDACSLKPACFEGGVCAAGNLSTSE